MLPASTSRCSVDQLLHIRHVQTNGGFVQHVLGCGGALLLRHALAAYIGSDFCQLGDRFDAPASPPRQRRAGAGRG